MNVFASDLDQTLIYSSKWLQDGCDARLIETIEERPVSYILESTIKVLDQIMTSHAFIPVTTRTEAQYRRINHGLDVDYAIVLNGGKVLINGEIDQEWASQVSKALMQGMTYDDAFSKLKPLVDVKGVEKLRDAEGVFLYLIVNEEFDRTVLENYRHALDDWQMNDQGRKIYFVPNAVQKGKALRYVLNKIHAHKVVAAGDSLLDLSMRPECDVFIAPEHGKIDSDIPLTCKGILNGYHIAEHALRILNES